MREFIENVREFAKEKTDDAIILSLVTGAVLSKALRSIFWIAAVVYAFVRLYSYGKKSEREE